MKIALWSMLRRRRSKLFEFKCRPTGRFAGFVMDASPSLVLLHRLDFDTFTLNGFTALAEADITEWRCFDRQAYWQLRAAEHFRLVPANATNIPLTSFGDLLGCPTLATRLVAIDRARIRPDVCYIGLVERVTEREVTLQDLNYNAEWTGRRRLRLADVTSVDFDDGYLRALEATAPDRAQLKRIA